MLQNMCYRTQTQISTKNTEKHKKTQKNLRKMCRHPVLVVEVPTDAHVETGRIAGVVGCPEVTTVALVDVVVLNIESATF